MGLAEVIGQLGVGPVGPVEPLAGPPMTQRRITRARRAGMAGGWPLALRGTRAAMPPSR
jgi:hypothetical protein